MFRFVPRESFWRSYQMWRYLSHYHTADQPWVLTLSMLCYSLIKKGQLQDTFLQWMNRNEFEVVIQRVDINSAQADPIHVGTIGRQRQYVVRLRRVRSSICPLLHQHSYDSVNNFIGANFFSNGSILCISTATWRFQEQCNFPYDTFTQSTDT